MVEKKKISFYDLINLDSKEICEAAIKNGWIAALISLSITLVFSLIGLFTKSENKSINYFLDPWLFLDVMLIAILAFFIYKKSRTAATLMFGYFLLSKFLQWYELGSAQGLPMALIFMFFYFTAMRGTFIWHSKYKNQDMENELEDDDDDDDAK